jgi:serine phosphatase RsbU (regulator of sigma subunit)
MKRFLIIIFLLTLPIIPAAGAQSVKQDSLETRLHTVEEMEKIPILIELMELTQQNHPQNALLYAAEADQLLELYPDPVYESLLLNRTGWVHYYLNEYDTAMDFAKQAEQHAVAASDPVNIARSKLLRGRLLRQEDHYDLALAALDSALAWTNEIDSPLIRASILNETGTVYRRKGESMRALEFHSRALDIIEQTGDKAALSSTFNFLGIMHDIIGNYDESLRFHLQSLAVREELNDRRGMAASMTNIGTLHQRIGQYTEALSFYEQSLPIWRDLEARDALATTLNNIGAVYELLGEYEPARTYYEDAYEIWREHGNLYSVTISLDNLGAIYMYLGDFDQALAYKKESLENHMALGNSRGSSNTLNSIAMIYMKTQRPDSALAAAHRSLDTAIESNSWSLIRNAHEMLSDIYEESGNFEQALEHHKLFKAAHDTLFNADSQTIIAEMQEQYRTRQQQQQIELLQQERELQRLWLIILIGGFLLLLIVSVLLYNRYRFKIRTRDQLHQAELEKARLYADSIDARTKLLDAENKRKSRELEDARKLQLSMLPDTLPRNRHASIAAFMETAAEVGGDYYDVAMSDDGTLTFCIGDATGHGTSAGLLVTAMKSLFNLMSEEEDLTMIMQRCSAAIKKMNLPRLYMAFALARLKGHTLELVGAGMPPALIYRADTGKVESVDLKGMPLGSVPDYPYFRETVLLHDDDVLLLLSDGYPELVNQSGEMLGYDNAAELLSTTGNLSAEKIIEQFRNKAHEWTQSVRPNDDVTFIAVKKHPLKKSSSAPDKTKRKPVAV